MFNQNKNDEIYDGYVDEIVDKRIGKRLDADSCYIMFNSSDSSAKYEDSKLAMAAYKFTKDLLDVLNNYYKITDVGWGCIIEDDFQGDRYIGTKLTGQFFIEIKDKYMKDDRYKKSNYQCVSGDGSICVDMPNDFYIDRAQEDVDLSSYVGRTFSTITMKSYRNKKALNNRFFKNAIPMFSSSMSGLGFGGALKDMGLSRYLNLTIYGKKVNVQNLKSITFVIYPDNPSTIIVGMTDRKNRRIEKEIPVADMKKIKVNSTPMEYRLFDSFDDVQSVKINFFDSIKLIS